MIRDYLRIPDVSYRWVYVWQRNLFVWSKLIKSWLVAMVGEPVLYLLAIGFGIGQYIDRLVEGVPYFVFIAPGLVAATAMNAASYETTFGSFTRMNQQRTFHAIVATPVNMNEVAVGDLMYAATKALAHGIIYMALISGVLAVVYHAAPPWWGIVLAVPLLALEGVLFAAMGLLVTAFAKGYDYFSYYLTLVVSVMFFFAGVFFSLESLPPGVRSVGWVMPLTHPVRIMRALFLGELRPELWLDLGVMLGFTALFSVLAVNAIRIRLID
jgi:lipooligosaccharide transport system permease protein